jgi:hypothetical protein
VLLVCSMVSSACWASGSSCSSWFLLFTTWSRCRGPPLLHLLFLAHCHRPPTLVHPLLRCLFLGWCHQHVVHLVHLVHPCFCCLQPSNDAGDPPLLHLLFLVRCCRPPDLAHPSPCHECWYCHPHALCPVSTGHHVLH